MICHAGFDAGAAAASEVRLSIRARTLSVS
jgi:hypothetical protein